MHVPVIFDVVALVCVDDVVVAAPLSSTVEMIPNEYCFPESRAERFDGTSCPVCGFLFHQSPERYGLAREVLLMAQLIRRGTPVFGQFVCYVA